MCQERGFDTGRVFCAMREGEPTHEWVLLLPGRARQDPVRVCAEHLIVLAPEENPVQWLTDMRTVDGKRICHSGLLRDDPVVARYLEMEADLDRWHVPPFDGPSGKWPRESLATLRYIRKVRRIVQDRMLQESDGADEGEEE